MATKKAGSTAKKKTTTTKVRSTTTAKPSTTKVTTVKATPTPVVEASTSKVSAVASTAPRARFGNRTFIVSALIGEFIGTFLLTVAFMGAKGDPLYLGFALAGIVLIVGTLSGAHVNPAVTVGAWVTRKISTLRALGYIVAQVLGATLAFAALNLFLNSVAQPDAQSAAMLGQSTPQLFKVAELTGKNEWAVFFIEVIAAGIFTFAVAGARQIVNDRTAKALTIGLGILVAGVFATIAAGYVQANSVFNPAIALAVQAIDWSKISVMAIAAYLIAPLLGGVIGFGLRDLLSSTEKKA
ncbi:aquaporin [Candidatus Saccharibacteria bacterium]|nr:aquaporin [Candidatus Saccharibacteria bacterium]